MTDVTGSSAEDGDRKVLRDNAIFLELCHVCNLRCVHCYIPPGAKAEHTFLDAHLAGAILRQLSGLRFNRVVLTGGEPLTHRDFDRIYETAWNHKLAVSIFTNAQLLSRERMALFERKPPAEIRVSVFAGSRQSYAEVTKYDGFDFVRETITRLAEAGIPVSVKLPLLRQNQSDVAQFRRELTGLGIRSRGEVRIVPRFDGDREHLSWRLTPPEITAYSGWDHEAWLGAISRREEQESAPASVRRCLHDCRPFLVDPGGYLRLCFFIRDIGVDLRSKPLNEAISTLTDQLQRSALSPALVSCSACKFSRYCHYCPGWARAEVGQLGAPIPFLCGFFPR